MKLFKCIAVLITQASPHVQNIKILLESITVFSLLFCFPEGPFNLFKYEGMVLE